MLVLSIGYCYLGLYDSSGGGLVQLVSGNDTGHVNKVILHPCSPVSSEMNILSFTRGICYPALGQLSLLFSTG